MRLAPVGQDNEEPTFLLEGAHLPSPPQVVGDRHLKWQLAPGVEMMAWNRADKTLPGPEQNFRVTLGFNEFRGVRKIQLVVADIS